MGEEKRETKRKKEGGGRRDGSPVPPQIRELRRRARHHPCALQARVPWGEATSCVCRSKSTTSAPSDAPSLSTSCWLSEGSWLKNTSTWLLATSMALAGVSWAKAR